MIYVTGDTHGDFSRFDPILFPKQRKMDKSDTVIICGDFGGVWSGGTWEEALLDRLEQLPFTLAFLTGNHENYDRLETFPLTEWNGGKVRTIREHVLMLCRGQVFTIEGKTFFTMGGAQSHDLWNGVLDPEDPKFRQKYEFLSAEGEFFRVKGASWWPQELPEQAEYEEGWENLRRHDMKVDYVLTHCAPLEIQRKLVPLLHNGLYPENDLTEFLQQVSEQVSFGGWYFGHYHTERKMGPYRVIYGGIDRLA